MNKLVSFELSDMLYGIELDKVKEIFKFSKIDEINGVKNYIYGLVNIRGNITTLLDLYVLMELKKSKKLKQNKCIILKENYNTKNQVGVVIDKIRDVIDSSDFEEYIFTKDEKNLYLNIKKVFKQNNKNKELIMVLDIDKIVSKN